MAGLLLLRGRKKEGREIHFLVAVVVVVLVYGEGKVSVLSPCLPPSFPHFGPSTLGSYGRRRLRFATCQHTLPYKPIREEGS